MNKFEIGDIIRYIYANPLGSEGYRYVLNSKPGDYRILEIGHLYQNKRSFSVAGNSYVLITDIFREEI